MAQPPLERARDLGDLIRSIENIREQLTSVQDEYREQIPMWTIFGTGTLDHPGVHVMRLFLTLPQVMITNMLVRGESVEQLRELLPVGLTCLPRQPNDDVNIIEVWV